jgi:hypothetical protein
MADQRIVEFVKSRWCTIRLATALDQYLAINQTFGTFAAFRENNPVANKWFHFLIIPRDVDSGQFWLFSRAAQGGSGELVTAPGGEHNLRQWQLTGELWQCFDITPLASYDQDHKVRLTCVEDGRVVSTRWDGQAFLWNFTEGDEQQMLRLGEAGPIPMPTVPEIEGTSGSMDRDLLKVESFDDTQALEKTPPRVVSTQLIPFPFVNDTYPLGRRMRETPYYLLTRRCFWKKVKAREFPAAGEKEEELTWEVGFKENETSALEQTLKITIGAKVSYASEVGIAGEVSFAEERGEKWTRRSEVERYETEKGRYKVKYKDGERVLVVVWALVNQYTLTRTNGEPIGEVEFIEKDDLISRSHP